MHKAPWQGPTESNWLIDLIVTYSYWMLLVAIVKMLMFDLGEIDLAESGLLET